MSYAFVTSKCPIMPVRTEFHFNIFLQYLKFTYSLNKGLFFRFYGIFLFDGFLFGFVGSGFCFLNCKPECLR